MRIPERPFTCPAACPIAIICEDQQSKYDAARAIFFGTEAGPGMAGLAMELDAGVGELGLRGTPAGEKADIARAAMEELLGSVDNLKPAEFDRQAMGAACAGPVENRTGLPFGFDATLRCGSLAIDEGTRRAYTVVTEKAPDTDGQ